MFIHSACNSSSRCRRVCGSRWQSLTTQPHWCNKCSIGLKSGENAGHGSVLMPADIRRQSLDGKRELTHNSSDTDWIHDGQQRTGQILLEEPRCCNALQCEGHQWRRSRCEMKKEHATPHNYRPISLFSGSKTHQFSYRSTLHSMIWCILNWKYYD